MKPAISRSVVVLPQPDGPSRQTRLPCSICSETSSTTLSEAKNLVSPRNSTAATRSPLSCRPRINTAATATRPLVFRRNCQLPVKTGLRFSMKAVRPSM